jgi:hypothetical protein
MVDSALIPAIKEAIRQNEIGDQSPYRLSYARLGSSGASFGTFQGDTNRNDTAQSVLRQALVANGVDPAAIARIMAAVSEACPRGNPLSPDDSAIADAALSCDTGKQLVDAMDATLLQRVLAGIDSCTAAAAARQFTIEPAAQLYIALWVNMTGLPTTLSKWLSGTPEVGLAPPAGSPVTAQDLETYLQANSYFRDHPDHFPHMQEAVRAALPLLPAA